MYGSFAAGMGGNMAQFMGDYLQDQQKQKKKEGLAGMLSGIGKKGNKNFDYSAQGPEAEQFGPSNIQGFLASLFGV